VVTGLSQSTKYYWHVKTNNGGHFSDFSDVWHFYVSGVGQKELDDKANKIVVTPNPGNGVFVFNNIDRGDQIEIFDPSGKLIKSIVAEGDEEPVDLSFVKPRRGIFFYKVMNSTGTISEGKIIKE
jgi:hypothetical protein